MPDLEERASINPKEKPISKNINLRYIIPAAVPLLAGLGAAYCSRNFMSGNYIETTVFAGIITLIVTPLGMLFLPRN